MPTHRQPERNPSREDGFMLLAVVVMVALVLIALAVAAPVVARDLRRDKEVESQHRMEQYVRAIQLYQRLYKGQYPASIKALEKTNNIRFLRHQYVDPLTGKADYKLIHQGEQKTTIKVFFGEELAGLAANLGSAAGLASGTGGQGASSTSTIGATSALASGFSGASITTGSTGSTGSSGSSGTGMFGDSTGGVIVGVGTSRSGDSISQPNQQTTYETWEFWYDPRIELLRKGVSVTGGGMTSQSASSFGQDAVTGQPNAGATGPTGSTGNLGSPGSTGSTGSTSPF
jgi:type II secretory pathway pseudopilin PulG